MVKRCTAVEMWVVNLFLIELLHCPSFSVFRYVRHFLQYFRVLRYSLSHHYTLRYVFPVLSYVCFCSYLYCCIITGLSFSRGKKPTPKILPRIQPAVVPSLEQLKSVRLTQQPTYNLQLLSVSGSCVGPAVKQTIPSALGGKADSQAVPTLAWKRSPVTVFPKLGLPTCTCIFFLFLFSCSLCTSVKSEEKGGDGETSSWELERAKTKGEEQKLQKLSLLLGKW